ncbi:MAG: hypothetical protein R2856_11655 [Caldilineaceae bacterium]
MRQDGKAVLEHVLAWENWVGILLVAGGQPVITATIMCRRFDHVSAV